MTAVIAILNKSAVAIAADSAVTVTSNDRSSKVYNTANKIFQLSKYKPVGLVIYNSASLINTPWEIIIKMYRDHLGDKGFDSLEEYRINFLSYIQSSIDLLLPEGKNEVLAKPLFTLLDDAYRRVIPVSNILSSKNQLVQPLIDVIRVLTDFCLARPTNNGVSNVSIYESTFEDLAVGLTNVLIQNDLLNDDIIQAMKS